MSIISTTPATGWFFYFKSANKIIYYRLAVWATYDDGSVSGLLAVQKKDNEFNLVKPPSTEVGGYVHWDDLNQDQKEKALGGVVNEEVLLKSIEERVPSEAV